MTLHNVLSIVTLLLLLTLIGRALIQFGAHL